MDWSLGEQRHGVSAVVSDPSVVDLVDDRSVFEKGFEMLCFDPEGTAPVEDVALVGRVEVLVEGEGTVDFADAAARLIAARPLALIADILELALLGVFEVGAARADREEQLCSLGKRCAGQNFW